MLPRPANDRAPPAVTRAPSDDAMLNQHRNLVVPEADHLRVGDCVVDIARREVDGRGDEPRRITLKALQVLLVLAAHQGKVVSREALLEWVWADTMPTDDVLTQAVTQLRKAFGDDRDAPQYIETIAKGGYRLLAPVEWLQAPPSPPIPVAAAPAPRSAEVIAMRRHAAAEPAPEASAEPATPSAAPAPARRRMPAFAWALPVAAIAVAVAAFAWWPRRAADPPAPAPVAAPPAAAVAPAQYQRITSLPGSEMWPSLSPDGAQVVYSAWVPEGDQAGLLVQTTAPVTARAITEPPKGVQDNMPVWSPNGREIAFERWGPGDRCGLYIVPASGGAARHVADCRRGSEGTFSWHPDGRHLIASGLGVFEDDGALHLLDLATGEWTPLAYDKGESDYDLAPVYSPDGKWIAFHRNISLSDVWRVPAAGGKPERLTGLRTNIFGLAWTPDSRAIVFSRYQDASVQLSQVDVDSHAVRDLGIENAGWPAIAARAPSMAFIVDQTETVLFRADLAHPQTPPQRVFPSSGMDLMPSVSPDGNQIAYMSDRSGRMALWWGRLGQADSLRLIEGVTPVPRFGAVWSAAGDRFLVVGRDGVQLALYEVAPESGRVQRLPVPAGDVVHGAYVPGTDRLLVVVDQGAGRLGLTLYDRARTPWRTLAQLDDVLMTRVDPARKRILFTRPTSSGLWQAGLDLRDVRKISESPAVGASRRLALTADGLRLATGGRDCVLRWLPLEGLEKTQVAQSPCRHEGEMRVSSISLDEDRQLLYYAAEHTTNSDIGWMPLADR